MSDIPDDVVRKYVAEMQTARDELARLNEPLERAADAWQFHRKVIEKMGINQEVLTRLSAPYEQAQRLARIIQGPDLSATVQRIADLQAQSESAAKALDAIAGSATTSETEHVATTLPLPPGVLATESVAQEVRNLARIAAATARTTGAVAEASRECLEQTIVLVAAVQQLQDTTKSGIDASEKAAKRLVNTVSDLIDTTDAGLDANYKRAAELIGTVDKLHATTKAGVDSNERTARWLIGLTVALLLLTAVIAVLTGVLLARTP